VLAELRAGREALAGRGGCPLLALTAQLQYEQLKPASDGATIFHDRDGALDLGHFQHARFLAQVVAQEAEHATEHDPSAEHHAGREALQRARRSRLAKLVDLRLDFVVRHISSPP
jgi:hypothetical protein